MMLVILSIVMIMIGYMFLLLSYLIPIFRIIYLDWIGSIFFIIPIIIVFYRIYVTDTYALTDRVPRWKQFVAYLRRDNRAVPLIGERAYAGESFIDIPFLGLMEFLGKDCVYTWGDKKIIWGLENINFSPDPRYGNFTHTLWKLGFANSDEVKEVLGGGNPDLRFKVYNNMLGWVKPVDRLTNDLMSYDGKKKFFAPVKKKEEDISHEAEKFIDSWSK